MQLPSERIYVSKIKIPKYHSMASHKKNQYKRSNRSLFSETKPQNGVRECNEPTVFWLSFIFIWCLFLAKAYWFLQLSLFGDDMMFSLWDDCFPLYCQGHYGLQTFEFAKACVCGFGGFVIGKIQDV